MPTWIALVALYTSAWIEIASLTPLLLTSATSHSTRVRGLKYLTNLTIHRIRSVALYTSAWIEIMT